MKVRALLALALVALFSSVASAQDVVLTDAESGMTLTLTGSWVVVENPEAAVAANEEGCLLVLNAVPVAEADAAIAELDGFVGSFIENPVVASMEADEAAGAFAAMGTGTSEGEAVEWLFAGGVEGDWFGMIFAAATESATTCSAEMEALLGSM